MHRSIVVHKCTLPRQQRRPACLMALHALRANIHAPLQAPFETRLGTRRNQEIPLKIAWKNAKITQSTQIRF